MKERIFLFLQKCSRSRDVTISILIHFLIIVFFGTALVVTERPKEPADFVAEVLPAPEQAMPTPSEAVGSVSMEDFHSKPTVPASSSNRPIVSPSQFDISPSSVENTLVSVPPSHIPDDIKIPSQSLSDRPSEEIRKGIADTVKGWTPAGGSTDRNNPKYDFPVFLAQYSDGNWNSTVHVEGSHVTAGSLPNLLYYLDRVSKQRIHGNEKNIQVVHLDSPDLLAKMPPFVLFTGTRDFKLTENEVKNLHAYLLRGGAIWGDSSVPGNRSRFDIAFRREMKRILPDKDKNFEPLPQDHPLYAHGYFSDITKVVPGMNHYEEPIYAIKLFGQIAILYTANDYADMWQMGLWLDPQSKKTALDLRKNEYQQYVATNGAFLYYQGIYLHNLSLNALESSYKLGANVIVHLLGRWDDLTRGNAQKL